VKSHASIPHIFTLTNKRDSVLRECNLIALFRMGSQKIVVILCTTVAVVVQSFKTGLLKVMYPVTSYSRELVSTRLFVIQKVSNYRLYLGGKVSTLRHKAFAVSTIAGTVREGRSVQSPCPSFLNTVQVILGF
jgi:hypothetical protein